MAKRIVDLMNFLDARCYSEKNRYNHSEKDIKLTENEEFLLKKFSSVNLSILSFEDKCDFQKLCIKKEIYQAVSNGKSYIDFIIPYPLIDEVGIWVKNEGYCLCSTPIDYSYYFVDENGYCRFHQAKETNPKTNCNYRVLW